MGHYKHKLLNYIPIVLDGKQLENCVKTKILIELTIYKFKNKILTNGQFLLLANNIRKY